jgi:hypothetical protein
MTAADNEDPWGTPPPTHTETQWVGVVNHIYATADRGWCRHCSHEPELVEQGPNHLILRLVHHEACPARERGWSVDILPSAATATTQESHA